VHDVIIAHVISADAQIYRCGNGKVILGPTGHMLQPAGKNTTTVANKGLEKAEPVFNQVFKDQQPNVRCKRLVYSKVKMMSI